MMSKKLTYEELAQRVEELEQAELAGRKTLKASTEKLQLVIDTSPLGICTVDGHGNFITTNLAYEQMLDYSKEELQGLSFYDITHPAYLEENKKLFDTMFSFESAGFKIKKKDIRKDGTVIDVSVHTTAVKGDEDIRFGTIFVEDTTEQKKAIEEKDAYRGFLDLIPGYGFAKDLNSIYLNATRPFCDLVNLPYEQVYGKTDYDIFPAQLAKEYIDQDRQVIDTGIPLVGEQVTVDAKTNQRFIVAIRKHPLFDEKGNITGIYGMGFDITHIKMVEESLQKVNEKLKSKSVELEDMNTALEVLLKKRDQDNQELQENIYSNYTLMVTPFLSKLKTRLARGDQQKLLDVIETNLIEIIAPFARKLSNPMMSLTSAEIQIATMIKQGFTNKEISTTFNCSKRTIDTHRENIRKKLDLTNKKVNLKTFLSNL